MIYIYICVCVYAVPGMPNGAPAGSSECESVTAEDAESSESSGPVPTAKAKAPSVNPPPPPAPRRSMPGPRATETPARGGSSNSVSLAPGRRSLPARGREPTRGEALRGEVSPACSARCSDSADASPCAG